MALRADDGGGDVGDGLITPVVKKRSDGDVHGLVETRILKVWVVLN